jgi:sulfite exporter TauE/SafE
MGLMSSFHCISMCGPISLALPIHGQTKLKQFSGLLIYNAGRAFTYSFFGIVIGSVGSVVGWIGYLRYLSIFSGVLILLYVIWPSRFSRVLSTPGFWQKMVKRLKKGMSAMLKSKTLTGWLTLGILNGMIPCGLVYLALISSVATGSAMNGGLFMLIFGLGTFPTMMAVGFSKNLISPVIRNKIRKFSPVILALAGLLLVTRGLLIQYPATGSVQHHPIPICEGK